MLLYLYIYFVFHVYGFSDSKLTKEKTIYYFETLLIMISVNLSFDSNSLSKEDQQLNDKKSEDKELKNSKVFSSFVQVSQLSITMLSCVLVGVLLGGFLDKAFKTTPWLLLIFSFLGMGAAIKSIFELSKTNNSEERKMKNNNEHENTDNED